MSVLWCVLVEVVVVLEVFVKECQGCTFWGPWCLLDDMLVMWVGGSLPAGVSVSVLYGCKGEVSSLGQEVFLSLVGNLCNSEVVVFLLQLC